jgi:hypothetical protein
MRKKEKKKKNYIKDILNTSISKVGEKQGNDLCTIIKDSE